MSASEFLLKAWDWKPWVIFGCAGLAMAYGAVLQLRFSARASAWFAGLLLILLALVSPLDLLAGRYLFSVHMARHILFVLIVPALLLVGTPARPVARILRHGTLARAERILRPPAVAWLAGIGGMAFWHIPAVFNAALSSKPLQIAEPVSLLICGTIYWWPILSPLPRSRINPVPQAAAYLFTSCLACTSIGVLVTFAPRLLYPGYAHPADPYGILPMIRNGLGISPAMDQQIGGLLMWVPGCLVYLTATMAMFARWYAQDTEAPAEAL